MLQNGKVLSKDFLEKTIVLQTLLTWQQLAKIGKDSAIINVILKF